MAFRRPRSLRQGEVFAAWSLLAYLLLVYAGCDLFSHDKILVPVNVSRSPERSEYPTCAVDSRGTVHLVWSDYSLAGEDVLYAFKNRGDTWSLPANISHDAQPSRLPSVAVGPDDRVHLAWQHFAPDGRWRILYTWKMPAGDWAIPETLAGGSDYVRPRVCVDGLGRVHMTWEWGGYYSGLAYAMRDADGEWGGQTAITDPDSFVATWQRVGVDQSGGVHVTCVGFPRDFSRFDVWYVSKPSNSAWSKPENITSADKPSGGLGMVVDADGTVHAVWSDDRAYRRGGKYRSRSPDGSWSPASLLLSESLKVGLYWECLAAGPGGRLYLPGVARLESGDGQYELYIQRDPAGSWSDTLVCGVVKYEPAGLPLSTMLVDQLGTMFMFGERSPDRSNLDNEDIFCIEYKPKE